MKKKCKLVLLQRVSRGIIGGELTEKFNYLLFSHDKKKKWKSVLPFKYLCRREADVTRTDEKVAAEIWRFHVSGIQNGETPNPCKNKKKKKRGRAGVIVLILKSNANQTNSLLL